MRNTISQRFPVVVRFYAYVAVATLLALSRALATTLEPIVAEKYCDIQGLAKPSRQTIVVLDQSLIIANPAGGIATENQHWLKDLRGLLDPSAPGRVATFLPRERVSLYLASPAGTQPTLLFTGCVPRFSPEELSDAEGKKTQAGRVVDYLFETGAAASAADYANQLFQRKLTLRLAQLEPIADSTADASAPVILRALGRDRQLINLQNGIPRVILVAKLSAPESADLKDRQSARAWGFALAKELGVRLQRAEVYVVSKSSPQLQEAYQAFFLASEGDLVAWSEEMIGVFGANPNSVRVFRGKVSYCQNEFPMELRLSVDSEGQLNSSWIAVSIQNRTSTPVRGAIVCENPSHCSLASLDGGLGQLWSATGESTGEPEISAALPWSGFRRVDATLDGKQMSGRIWDPIGKLECNDKSQTSYTFQLTQAEGIPF